jgi:hypothetical protein
MPDVQVRIAVAVDKSGRWNSSGGSGIDERDSLRWCTDCIDTPSKVYWLTATLPVPEAQTVRAEVSDAKE